MTINRSTNPKKGRETHIKILLIFVSLSISILFGEIMLRYFTIFPISRNSNQIDDSRLGYRLSPSLPDVDEYGFRNIDGARDNFKIAAIGDSHTHGFHVDFEDAWPAVFGELTGISTYNYGVPSYDIFAYHALILDAVERGAQGIIVAIYPTNDFNGSPFRYCSDGGDFSFWEEQISELQLDLAEDVSECRPKPASTDGGILGAIEASAIFSAINHLVLKKITVYSRRSHWLADLSINLNNLKYIFGIPEAGVVEDRFYRFPGDILPLYKRKLRSVTQKDLDTLPNFKKLAESWYRTARNHGIKLGVLLVPSREQVVYVYLEQQGLLDQADPEFRETIESQIDFDKMIERILDKIGIPYQEASSDTAVAMGEAMDADRNFYPGTDGHPLEDGYRAYALAAQRLWNGLSN